MKFRALTRNTAITLFAALVMPLCMAAQDNPSQGLKPKHQKYRLIDLGTFGGPASSFPNLNHILNNQGVAAGGADTSVPDPNAPNCFNLECFVSHTFEWRDGVRADLGALAGVNSSYPSGINDRGLVVGYSQNGLIDPLTGVPEFNAVLWRAGGIVDLGTFGGSFSLATGINNHSQVSGAATNSTPDPFSMLGLGTETKAFLWHDGEMHDLGTLGGPDSFGEILNESGQVAGESYTNSIPNPLTGIPTTDPFLWDRQMRDLGTLGGTYGHSNNLNNRGQVVGYSNLAGDSTFHPFVWDRGVLKDLGTLGGDNGQATWVNDAGDVVGEADLVGSLVHDAFLWKHGVITDLGNLGRTSFAFAINSRGQVVGHSLSNDGTFRAFLWEDNGPMIDLNALIPRHSSLLLTDAVSINNRGEIAGAGVPAGCQPGDVETCGHALLLIPDGDCDHDNEARIAATQNRIAAERTAAAQYLATTKQANESPLSPVERIRSMMRQRHRLPGQPVAPRD